MRSVCYQKHRLIGRQEDRADSERKIAIPALGKRDRMPARMGSPYDLADIGRQIERLALDHDASLAGPSRGYFSFGPDFLQFAALQWLTSFANRPPVALQVPMGHLPASPPNICIPRPEYWAEAVSTKLNTRTNAATVISVKILNIMPSLESADAKACLSTHHQRAANTNIASGTVEDQSNKMANTVNRNTRLRKTYNPVNVSSVRRFDEARAAGARILEQKPTKSICTPALEILQQER
jgi:hypothetical protein